MSYDTDTSAPGEIVVIDPFTEEVWHLPLLRQRPKVDASGIGTYPPKNVIEDYTRAHHQILSSFQVSSLSGGMLVRDQQEASDTQRYYHGTMQTRWARQFVNARKPYVLAGPGGAAIPLGDRGFAQTMIAFGTDLHELVDDESTVSVATLSADPLPNGSADWAGSGGTTYLYIPLGDDGYDRWDGITVAHDATIPAVCFCRFDLGIYALTTDCRLMQSVDGTTWTQKAQLDRAEIPRGLVDFWDKNNDPALHIITDAGVYGVDLEAEKAYRVKGSPPRHPYAGSATCEFRAELYTSYGMGVNKYSGGDFLPMGLDNRNGLPADWRGNITAMVDGYSAMYALVEGDVPAEDVAEETIMVDSIRHSPSFTGSAGVNHIAQYDGLGWSTLWRGDPGTDVHGMVMANAGGYRLLWGHGEDVYNLPMVSDFFNPLERWDGGPYQESSYLHTATTDFNQVGIDKLLVGVEAIVSNLTDEAGNRREVEIWYQLDAGPWTLLGTLDDDNGGRPHLLKFGANGVFPGTDTARYDGIYGDRITLELITHTDDEEQTPVVESYGLVYHALMGVLEAFQVSIDCGHEIDVYKGKTGAERLAFIEKILPGKLLVPLLHRDEWRSVRLVGESGQDATGPKVASIRRLQWVEVG